jgi:ATP-binding cassette subfamily C protein CydC
MAGDMAGGMAGATPLFRIARLARPVRIRLALALGAGVVAAAMAVGLTATSAWLISRASERPPVLYLMVAIVAVRAFGVGRGAFRYAERLAAHDSAFRVLARLRAHAYRRLERLAPAGLAEDRSGDLLARLVVDVDGLADVWLRVLLPYGVAGLVGATTVLLVSAIVPLAGATLAVTLLIAALGAPLAAGVVASRAERRIAPARGQLAAAALDLLRGAPELVVAGAAERRLAELRQLDGRLCRAEGRAAAGAGVGALVSGLAGGAAVWLGLVAGIAAVRSGRLEGVALAVVALTPIAIHELVAGLAPVAQQLPRLAQSAARVVELWDRPDPVVDPVSPASVPAGPYGLRIRGLGARYGPDGPEILGGVDLDLGPGERVLVTGPSGSGKSTLAAVLLRFLEPSRGTVELVGSDGTVALPSLTGDQVRRVIGLCAQDVHLFDTTIADNVRLARPEATDAEFRAALRRARLDDWVAGLPLGPETLVGEHGARLSGGQRQRIGLARALLADWPVIVFDEPTEHLDEATATELTRDLLATAAGRTALFITHRPELMAAVAPAPVLELGGEAAGTRSVAGRRPGVRADGDRLARPGPVAVRTDVEDRVGQPSQPHRQREVAGRGPAPA